MTENTVPVLMCFGLVDSVVPICHSKLLLQALEKNQVPHNCIEFPNSGHALACNIDKTEELKKYIDIYCEKYF